MKKTTFILLFLICSAAVFSQEFVVLGKVIDSATRQPLTGASVFCQSTTKGTLSNNDGLFYMRLPNGGYDLVITYTGYEKKTMRISNTHASTDTLLIEMPKEDKSLEEVAVVATNEVADGWTKYGQFFLDNFIGTTPATAQCKFQNPEVLHFFYTKKRNRLKVTSKEDLIIMNYALGYKIHYQLDSFSYDYNTNISQYTGSPFFEEIDSTADMKSAWKKNRAHTYLGSRLHFMRSLRDSAANDEGFIVEKLDDDPASVNGTVISNLYDSSYYGVDSDGVNINWKGRYRISYKSVMPDKKFLEDFKLPANSRYQVTVIDVADGFVIEANGYFYDEYDVTNNGYWAWKKLAELLPYDYKYE
jgi:hypothetical protein